MVDIGTAQVLSIREYGNDEYWLRDKIFADPSILKLGELQPISKERMQSQGGRLDLLLKDPEDDSMFEVELQLGATDETHIIRTIEYWANEKRKWPKRSHTAVLVAEEITSRFFNVVQLLSLAVPIIGIQANLVKVGESVALHFNKIIDSYEEPEETEAQPTPQIDENHWIKNYAGPLECVKWYKALLEKLYGDVSIKYFEWYVSLSISGVARVWIDRRRSNRVFVQLKVGEQYFQEAIDYLTAQGLSFRMGGGEYLKFNVNLQELKTSTGAHEWLASLLSPQHLRMKTPKNASVGG